ncbi:MAG: dihydroorotate dehydrogenase electron transfer subunit [Desulfohalobiaceae bacterium]|nr:dihydroorotate dehydrogenase electron transfer subunit [Desulfohalobiaceae bacterium]
MPSCHELQVVELNRLGNGRFIHLRLQSPNWEWTPGQFVMLRPSSWGPDPFGARPFSIADLDEQGLHIYFQVVGRGTKLLAGLAPGDRVHVWGPLGRGFDYGLENPLLLLAGGMGLAPFVGLIKSHPTPINLELIFGHRHDLEGYPFQELKQQTLAWSFQDKSAEDLLELKRVLGLKIRGYAPEGEILACGPFPFLKMVKELSKGCGARTQVSLETVMMCGVGACLGCVVPGENKASLKACSQGPVFRAEEVML